MVFIGAGESERALKRDDSIEEFGAGVFPVVRLAGMRFEIGSVKGRKTILLL